MNCCRITFWAVLAQNEALRVKFGFRGCVIARDTNLTDQEGFGAHNEPLQTIKKPGYRAISPFIIADKSKLGLLLAALSLLFVRSNYSALVLVGAMQDNSHI